MKVCPNASPRRDRVATGRLLFVSFISLVSLIALGCRHGRDATPPSPQPLAVQGERTAIVAGHPMHYWEAGRGRPIVLLHGLPTSGYLWRNVAPRLANEARVIVPDLMGYGQSYHGPDLSYDLASQQRYFDEFMEQLELQGAVLVVNDLGSVLGLHWASRHPDQVAGLVFVEAAIFGAEGWWDHLAPKYKFMFWLMQNERRARRLIVDENMMVETMIPKIGVQRDLTEVEMEAYRAPFEDPDVRARVLLPAGPATAPFRGRSGVSGPAGAHMDAYAPWLAATPIPKLLLWSRPGLLGNRRAVKGARRTFTSLETRALGQGVHYLPEDHPEAIASEVARFVASLNRRDAGGRFTGVTLERTEGRSFTSSPDRRARRSVDAEHAGVAAKCEELGERGRVEVDRDPRRFVCASP